MMHSHLEDWNFDETALDDTLSDVAAILASGNVALARRELREAPMDARDDLAFAIHDEVTSLLDAGLAGRTAERLALFDDPKFASVEACAEAYSKAMEARA